MYFRQGDIIWLDFQPTRGHEQTGRRPAVVVSATSFNKISGMTLVCPITSTERAYPSRIPIPDGLSVTGFCECEQARCIDITQRNASLICHAPRDFIERVSQFIIGIVMPEK